MFEFTESKDLAARAELDTKIYALGVRFAKEHFSTVYDLPEDSFTLVEVPPSPSPSPALGFAAPAALAAHPSPTDSGQDALDALADEMLESGAQTVRRQADSLLNLLERAESYDDARLLVAEALGPDAEDQLTDELLNGMINAAMLGRWAARKETE